MQQKQAFKYELRPNGEQKNSMSQFAGCRRFVYNKALALQKENYASGNKFISYETMAKSLTVWRHEETTPWLKEAPCHPLQHALKDCERAYKNFFAKRAELPRFKRKGNGECFRYPDAKQIKLDEKNRRIFLPKLGWIRYRKSRNIQGELRNVTVSHSGGRWFMSVQTQREVEQPIHPSTSIIGIDVGIARFATFSDGTFLEPLNALKKESERLAKYQRRMSHKEKFSKNWKKAKARVQKIHVRIANARRDFLHKITTMISKKHAVICIEDLKVRNMSKSAKGSIEEPGRNISAKSGLNKSILDQGWFEFRRQLEYKQTWLGGEVLALSPCNTSRTCPTCHHMSLENRLTQAEFACVECGYKNHADIVGAMNILERGHRLLACGELVQEDLSVKQEPAEVSQLTC